MVLNPRTFIDYYIKAMNNHDVDAVLRFFTADAAYEDAALGIVSRGKNELAEFVGFFFDCHTISSTPLTASLAIMTELPGSGPYVARIPKPATQEFLPTVSRF